MVSIYEFKYMVLLRKFSEKEILEIVSKYACESLPKDTHGIIEAQYNKKKREVEVYFIESINSSNIFS